MTDVWDCKVCDSVMNQYYVNRDTIPYEVTLKCPNCGNKVEVNE